MTIVQKFGGTSLATPQQIRAAARRALAARAEGNDIVVVVSAMAGETDRLLSLATEVAGSPDASESDVAAATGEMVTASLTALAIQAEGGRSRSYLGFQLPIRTDDRAGAARILSVETAPLRASLDRGEIPVVAGFQGVDPAGRLTTLGRGGSDTTAVALAAALGARCEIYKDVDGVFTADPRVCADAVLLPEVSYRFMLEATSLGAKVLHDRSVAMGMRYGVPLAVRSSFRDAPGTRITAAESRAACVTLGRSVSPALAKVSLVGHAACDPARVIPDTVSRLSAIGIACRGLHAGSLSVSFLVEQARAAETARLLHHHYANTEAA